MKELLRATLSVVLLVGLSAGVIAASWEIVDAQYGAEPNWVNVTATVKAARQGEQLKIEVNEEKFGDPAYGREKQLKVMLKYNDKTMVVKARENSVLVLTKEILEQKLNNPQTPEWTKITLSDNNAELTNPGMGFVLHYYDNSVNCFGRRLAPDDLMTDWPGMNLIYLRLPWAYVEPQEGQYNWSVLDTPMQRFAQRGIKTAFRFTCSENWMEYPTPKWVADAGAKGYRFTPWQGILPNGKYWEPDYNDPIFLQKLENFLKAVAERYDGDPNLEFIDIGSFGVWGEGHTWASTMKPYPDEIIKKHIDLHLKYFKKTRIIGEDDFASRPMVFKGAPTGKSVIRFDVSVPAEWEWHGEEFTVAAALKGKNRQGKGFSPLNGDKNGAGTLGTISISKAGVPVFKVNPDLHEVTADAFKNGADFAFTGARIIYDPIQQPHSLKIEADMFWPASQPEGSTFYAYLYTPGGNNDIQSLHTDAANRDESNSLHRLRPEKENQEITEYMASRGLGLRDDSILMQPFAMGYLHAGMTQNFWRNNMVILESQHFNEKSEKLQRWQNGLGYLFAVEDYHASYIAAHSWPREFFSKRRDLVKKINLRIGYRYLPMEIAWTSAIKQDEAFTVKWQWRNEGVAPSYTPLYPTITLKDAKGGIVAVFADDSFRLDKLPVCARGAAPAQAMEKSFLLPFHFHLKPGEYDVYISVGGKTGLPAIFLPLDGSDGAKRYKIGTCSILESQSEKIKQVH